MECQPLVELLRGAKRMFTVHAKVLCAQNISHGIPRLRFDSSSTSASGGGGGGGGAAMARLSRIHAFEQFTWAQDID